MVAVSRYSMIEKLQPYPHVDNIILVTYRDYDISIL